MLALAFHHFFITKVAVFLPLTFPFHSHAGNGIGNYLLVEFSFLLLTILYCASARVFTKTMSENDVLKHFFLGMRILQGTYFSTVAFLTCVVPVLSTIRTSTLSIFSRASAILYEHPRFGTFTKHLTIRTLVGQAPKAQRHAIIQNGNAFTKALNIGGSGPHIAEATNDKAIINNYRYKIPRNSNRQIFV